MSSSSSTPESVREPPGRVEVGFVRRAHGIRGEVLVEVESDNPRRFAVGSRLFLNPKSGLTKTVQIAQSRVHKGGRIVRFEGCEERDYAESLAGAILEVDLSEVASAPQGTYYFFELLDCQCRDRESGDLGKVLGVVEDGGGLLLIVGDEERNLPIPFVEQFIEQIDTKAGFIEFQLPAGLVETCASAS
ncbi:MAG: ribosome maturation factor RimM [Deltaproteobacteria bacterium]|nr:ribosome maturation factor RimM [Deltaproteobacteria bacterium]